MAQSHERIFRCIIRLFGSFPIKTYSNRIPRDVDDLFTYEDVSERVHIIRRLHENYLDHDLHCNPDRDPEDVGLPVYTGHSLS